MFEHRVEWIAFARLGDILLVHIFTFDLIRPSMFVTFRSYIKHPTCPESLDPCMP